MAIYNGPWRDGEFLVVHERTSMPKRCPVCNGASTDESLRVAFSSGRKGGLIGNAVAAVHDKMKKWQYTGVVGTEIYFCAAHRSKRLYFYLASLAMAIAGGLILALFGQAFKEGEPPSVATFIGIILVALGIFVVFAVASGRLSVWFKPIRFWNRLVWLKGVDPQFLKDLPVRPDVEDER